MVQDTTQRLIFSFHANVNVMSLTKREARRKRNREDFARTQAAMPIGMKGTGYKIPPGPTYREHLEDEIKRAVAQWKKARGRDTDPLQVRAMRGVVRGLCRALLIYEDSYHKDDKEKLLKLEKEFLND